MASAKSSALSRVAPSHLKLGAALSLAAFMTACATAPTGPTPMPGPGPSVPPGTDVTSRDGVTPPFMRGQQIVRVGLLLPFSLRPQDASALYNAAELALFDHGSPNTLLIPRDAGADEASATAAARALVNDGADIIIGPVLREGVAGAGNAARAENIPVIGFSSDRTVAGNGIYLLSFQLEDEISRIVSYASEHNIRTIALLAPSNEYGRRVESALRAEARLHGVTITSAQLYSRTDTEAAAAATAMAATLRTTPTQGILIAESGQPLRSIATALVRGGVDQRQVRFMGTSVWAGEAQREPTLAGGWYVSPDLNSRDEFEGRYQNVYGQAPTRLASLGYDAVALAALLSRDAGARGFNRTAIENPEGFAGSDGLFRFRNNGAIERGLAIIEVRQNDVAVLEAAPRRFARQGS
ncbi:penicillin-binding protein activator [Vitreimonas flagellata]|uniref:penicillin-binding protein activator n=1 Tax=Vitreimonas flagellata TaxID=2560861 RepID=UPI001074D3F7|nr:penicillin-binding protein activator [Vitreimonas flagellata]